MDQSAAKLITPEDMALLMENCQTFEGLEHGAVERLLGHATVRRVPRNTLLFSQGDEADRFFVVLEGKVKLFTAMENGDQGVVEVIEPIRSFAEAAMFASRSFPVNAETIEGSRLILVPADPFMRELEENRDLAFGMLATLSRRYRRLMRQISDLKLKSPGQRLGTFLLSLTEVEEGPALVVLPFDKSLIASHVGMKPESLSRAMARLREVGVVCKRREVNIDDVAQLRGFCGDGEPVDIQERPARTAAE
ncbi:MAG: cyclic nucleotide-binding domain-containing protein [Rhodospirillales bacterium]|nr:cyclic nucleotide-binding domain-containing protein [Rhodospirillales bacterium]